MSFCYALMCHTDPEGVLDRVRRIRATSDAHILVRFSDPDFLPEKALTDLGAHRLLSRLRTRWGDMSLVDAALEMFTVARSITDSDHVVLISGQDQPVRHLADWEAEVRGWAVDAVLDPAVDQPEDHLWRWWVGAPPGIGGRRGESVVRGALVRAGAHLPGVQVLARPGEPRLWWGARRPRPAPPVLPVKCSQWVVLGRRAVDSVLARDHRDPALRRYFGQVRIPDEWYVSSLIADDPTLRIALGRTTSKVFLDGHPNPEWLDLGLLEDMRRRSSAPFVRKMPRNPEPALLAATDAMMRRTPAEVERDAVVARPRPVWAGRVRAQVVDTGTADE